MNTKVIVEIMGTDRFTVGKSVTRSTEDSAPAPRGGDLPLSKGNGGITRMECEVRTTEDAPTVSFSYSLSNGTDAAALIESIKGSNEPFETVGGVATTSYLSETHDSWRWACLAPSNAGSPIAGGSIGPDEVTESERKDLVDAVAAATGCPATSE
ncbi:hypothetical protein [Nocardioides sp. NPDC047086]|uniref:hypothetical protein n=1 Tax=Nocardioides sp. NPDC047086 TaxID=3154810 RepID=UPI0033F882BF